MKKRLKQSLNKFAHTLESCWLCLKYPFLYPRNRWTGNHWDSWKIREYLYGRRLWTVTSSVSLGIYGRAFEQIPKPNRKYDFETINKVKSWPWVIWYYIVYFIAEWILPVFHCIPTYTELDAMAPGWRKAFGKQLCDELKTQLKKDHYLYKYRITQIKEKWGYLHWYDNGHSQAVYDIISKYEDISWNTCIHCGKPATKITSGWIYPYCDGCFPKNYTVYI